MRDRFEEDGNRAPVSMEVQVGTFSKIRTVVNKGKEKPTRSVDPRVLARIQSYASSASRFQKRLTRETRRAVSTTGIISEVDPEILAVMASEGAWEISHEPSRTPDDPFREPDIHRFVAQAIHQQPIR